MSNPFSIIADFAELIVDVINDNEEQTRRIIAEERREKERLAAEKRQMEYEIWKQVTDEEHKNPDEFRVLPYGWSPFGITI